jgi:PAS domain S-box-containing protein
MKKKPPSPADDPNERIAALVLKLQETQRELQELTGGGIDGVLYSGGQSYLLQEAQEKLRQSAEAQSQLATTLLTILNAIPAHVALLDAQGVIISVNENWRHFAKANALQGPEFGVDQNYVEICERAVGECAEDSRAAARGIRRVLKGEAKDFFLEYPCHSPTEKRWFRLEVNPVRESGLTGAVVMHIDITARKLAEETTRESEERFRSMFNAAATGIAISTPHGRYLQANEAYCRMLGYTLNELLELNFAAVTHPDDLTLNLKMRDELLAGLRANFVMEKRYLKKNGNIVWTRHSVSATHSVDGEIATLIAVAEDVTQVKEAERLLVSKTALLEAELKSTLDGILIVDRDLKKILQNQQMADMWGIPQDVADDPDDRKQFDWVVGQVKHPREFVERANYLNTHVNETGRDELELLNGKTFDRYSAPVVGSDGKYHGRLWVFRDITERKVAEKALTEQVELISMASWLGKLGAWSAEYPGPKLIWGQEIYRIFEVEPGVEIEDQTAMTYFLPDSRAKMEAAIASQQPFDLELEIFTAKGNKRWVRATSAVEMKDGQLRRFYGLLQDVTEQKRTESRMRRLIDSNVQCVVFWNAQGKIMDANDAFFSLLGYTREELIGGDIGWRELTPAEFTERDDRALAEVKNRGLCATYEKEFIRKDGSRVPILIGSAIFEDNPDEGICFVIDLTERKRAESRFRRLVDSNAQGVMFWKASGAITDGNDAFLSLVGYSREELKAGRLNWMKLTPPEYLEADRRALEEIADKGICSSLEKEWIRKDGSRIPVYLSAAGFEDSPSEGVCFALDLTERKRVESRLRRLIDSNVQGVIFWNRAGEILDANEGFLRLVGYTREDLKAGRLNWKTLTPPEYNDLDLKALEEIAAKGVCTPFEKEYLRKDGSRVPVLIGSASFEDNPDEGVRFVLDLTERKKLEQQFLRAQRMESIGTLAGGVAHDLNNILAPIMMSIAILKSTSETPQTREILETLEVSAKRGADIVRQVLSFARGMEGERIEVQPKHLLKDLENIIKDTFPRGIELRFSIPNDTWTILGDPTQVHQILLNLCVNARDAMPSGGKLTISVENTVLDEHYAAMNLKAKPGRYVRINVTDSGTGIPQNIIDKIFEPFFTTKALNKGTGLGLSTVMAIVKSHEGIVNVYSEPGKGTTFKIYLPAAELSPEKGNAPSEPAHLPRGNGETILVIDDEASILTITRQTLQAFGYKVLTANDGAEAVAIYAENKHEIAVVVTDMMMPVMDGSSVIRVLTRINPAIKIVAASGLSANGSGHQVPDPRIKHFLTKPYTAETLLKTLRMILDEA